MSLVGTICVKLAGRDADHFCVILEEIDSRYVLVDGDTRRKKTSLKHLKLFSKKVSVTASSTTASVRKALADAGVPLRARSEKRKEKKERKAKPVSSHALRSQQKKEKIAKTEKKTKKNDKS